MAIVQRNSLAVYDLDGVITRRDTFSALVFERLRARPFRLVRALPTAARMIISRNSDQRHRAARRISEFALRGLSRDEYDALAIALGHRFGRDPSWVRPTTIARIQAQHNAGTRIVIATATERLLAKSLLASASVPYDHLSASELREECSGLVVADHRVGQRKAEALNDQRIEIRQAEFITDSFSDLPTAQCAARVILIGATEKTKRKYIQAGVRVVNVDQTT